MLPSVSRSRSAPISTVPSRRQRRTRVRAWSSSSTSRRAAARSRRCCWANACTVSSASSLATGAASGSAKVHCDACAPRRPMRAFKARRARCASARAVVAAMRACVAAACSSLSCKALMLPATWKRPASSADAAAAVATASRMTAIWSAPAAAYQASAVSAARLLSAAATSCWARSYSPSASRLRAGSISRSTSGRLRPRVILCGPSSRAAAPENVGLAMRLAATTSAWAMPSSA